MMPRPLIVAARRLAEVLDRENAALKAMDLRLAATLLAEKAVAIADLTESGESASEVPHPALLSTARSLDDLVLENRRLLERAIAAQQRVIGIVVRAAATAASESSYGAGGRLAHPTGPMALSTRA